MTDEFKDAQLEELMLFARLERKGSEPFRYDPTTMHPRWRRDFRAEQTERNRASRVDHMSGAASSRRKSPSSRAIEIWQSTASAGPAGLQTVENLSLLLIADQRRSENQEVFGPANGFSDFRHRHGHSSRHSSEITRPRSRGVDLIATPAGDRMFLRGSMQR